MHMYVRYKVSVIKPVDRRAVTDDDANANDNDDTRRTIHDCMGSSAISK